MMDSDKEYVLVDSDDSTSSLPDVTLASPCLTPSKKDRNFQTPPRSIPSNLIPETTLSPISSQNVLPLKADVKKLKENTEKMVRKVNMLKKESKKQLQFNKVDENISNILENGGILGLEEERQKRMQTEIAQDTDSDPAEEATNLDEIGYLNLPPDSMQGVSLFINPPNLIQLVDPPSLDLPVGVEKAIARADHPVLSEMLQSNMMAHWYTKNPCPTVMLKWLNQVACLCTDRKIAESARDTFCMIVLHHQRNGGIQLEQSFTQVFTIIEQLGAPADWSSVCNGLQTEVSTPNPSLGYMVANLLCITSCKVELCLVPDENALCELLKLLFRVLLDPVVFMGPLEGKVIACVDAIVQRLGQECLSMVSPSTMAFVRYVVKCDWQRAHIADILVLNSSCKKHFLSWFAIGCLKDSTQGCEIDNESYLDFTKLSIEELHKSDLIEVLCSSVVTLHRHFLANGVELKGFYPLLKILSVLTALLPSPDSERNVDIREEMIHKLRLLSAHIKEDRLSVWPCILKDCLKRIIDLVKP